MQSTDFAFYSESPLLFFLIRSWNKRSDHV